MRARRHLEQMRAKDVYGASFEVALVQCENIFNERRVYSSDVIADIYPDVDHVGANDLLYYESWPRVSSGYSEQQEGAPIFKTRTVDARGGEVDTGDVDIRYFQGLGATSISQILPPPMDVLLAPSISRLRLFIFRGTLTAYLAVPSQPAGLQQGTWRDPNGRIAVFLMNTSTEPISVDLHLDFSAMSLAGKGTIKIVGIRQSGEEFNLGTSTQGIEQASLALAGKEFKALILEPAVISNTFSDEECKTIFDSIGSFWSLHFEDKEVLCTLWNSYLDIISNMYLALYQADASKSLSLVPVETVGINEAFVFSADNAVEVSSGTPSVARYYIASTIVSIPELSEKTDGTGKVFKENVDYTIENGILSFSVAPWEYLGRPNTEDRFVLLAQRISHSESIVKRNFGYPLGLDLENTESAKIATQAIHSAYWVGATVLNVRLGSQALLRLPIVPIGSEVLSVYSGAESYTIYYRTEFGERRRIEVDKDIAPTDGNTIKVVTEDGVEHEISDLSALVGIGPLRTFLTISPFVKVYDYYSEKELVTEFAKGIGSKAWELFHTFFVSFNVQFYAKHIRYLIENGIIETPNDMFALLDDFLTRIKPVYSHYIYSFRISESNTIAPTEPPPELEAEIDLTQTVFFNYSRYYDTFVASKSRQSDVLLAVTFENSSAYGSGSGAIPDISGRNNSLVHFQGSQVDAENAPIDWYGKAGRLSPASDVAAILPVSPTEFDVDTFTMGCFIYVDDVYSAAFAKDTILAMNAIADPASSRWELFVAANQNIDFPQANYGLGFLYYDRNGIPNILPDLGNLGYFQGLGWQPVFIVSDMANQVLQMYMAGLNGTVAPIATVTGWSGFRKNATPIPLTFGTNGDLNARWFYHDTWIDDLFFVPRALTQAELNEIAQTGMQQFFKLPNESSVAAITSVYPTQEERDRISLQYFTFDEVHGRRGATDEHKTQALIQFDSGNGAAAYDSARNAYVRGFSTTHPGAEIIWRMQPVFDADAYKIRNESASIDDGSWLSIYLDDMTYGPLFSRARRRWGTNALKADPAGSAYMEIGDALPNSRASLIRHETMNQTPVDKLSMAAWIRPTGSGTVFELAGIPISGTPEITPSLSPIITPIITPVITPIVTGGGGVSPISGSGIYKDPPVLIRVSTPTPSQPGAPSIAAPRTPVVIEGNHFTFNGVGNISTLRLNFVNVIPAISIPVAGFAILSDTLVRFIMPDLPVVPGIDWTQTTVQQRTINVYAANQSGDSTLTQLLAFYTPTRTGNGNILYDPPVIRGISPSNVFDSVQPPPPPARPLVYSATGINFLGANGLPGIVSLSLIFADPNNNRQVTVPITQYTAISSTEIRFTIPNIITYLSSPIRFNQSIPGRLAVVTDPGGGYETLDGFVQITTPRSNIGVDQESFPPIRFDLVSPSPTAPIRQASTRTVIGDGFRGDRGTDNVTAITLAYELFQGGNSTIQITSFTIVSATQMIIQIPSTLSSFPVLPSGFISNATLVATSSQNRQSSSGPGFIRLTESESPIPGPIPVPVLPAPQPPEPPVIVRDLSPLLWQDIGSRLDISGDNFLDRRGNSRIIRIDYFVYRPDRTLFFQTELYSVQVIDNSHASVVIPNLYQFGRSIREGLIFPSLIAVVSDTQSQTFNAEVLGTDPLGAGTIISSRRIGVVGIPGDPGTGVGPGDPASDREKGTVGFGPGVFSTDRGAGSQDAIVISRREPDISEIETSILPLEPYIPEQVSAVLAKYGSAKNSIIETEDKWKKLNRAASHPGSTNELPEEVFDGKDYRKFVDDSTAAVDGRAVIDDLGDSRIPGISSGQFSSEDLRGRNTDAIDALSRPYVPEPAIIPGPVIESVTSGSVTHSGGGSLVIKTRNLFNDSYVGGIKSIYLRASDRLATKSFVYSIPHYSVLRDGSALAIVLPDVREALIDIGVADFIGNLVVATRWGEASFVLQYPTENVQWPSANDVKISRLAREASESATAARNLRIDGISAYRTTFSGGGAIYLQGAGFMSATGESNVLSVVVELRDNGTLIPVRSPNFVVISPTLIAATIPDIRDYVLEKIGSEIPATWIVVTEAGVGKFSEDAFKFRGQVDDEPAAGIDLAVTFVAPDEIVLPLDDLSEIPVEIGGRGFIDAESGNTRIKRVVFEFYAAAANDPVYVDLRVGERWTDSTNMSLSGADARYLGGTNIVIDFYDSVDRKVIAGALMGNRSPVRVPISLSITSVQENTIGGVLAKLPEFIFPLGAPVDFDVRIITIDGGNYLYDKKLRLVAKESEKLESTGHDIGLLRRVARTPAPLLTGKVPEFVAEPTGVVPTIQTLPPVISTSQIYVTSLAPIGHDYGVPAYRLIGEAFPPKDQILVKLVNVADRSDQIYCPVLWIRKGTVRSLIVDAADPEHGKMLDELLFVPGYGIDFEEVSGKKYYIHIENIGSPYNFVQLHDTTSDYLWLTFVDTTTLTSADIPDPSVNLISDPEGIGGSDSRREIFPRYAKVGSARHKVKIVGAHLCGTNNTGGGATISLNENPPVVEMVSDYGTISGKVLFACADLIYAEFDLSDTNNIPEIEWDVVIETEWRIAGGGIETVSVTLADAIETVDPEILANGRDAITPEIVGLSGTKFPESYEPLVHGEHQLTLLVDHVDGFSVVAYDQIPGITHVFAGPTISDLTIQLKVAKEGDNFATSNVATVGLGLVARGRGVMDDYFGIMPWREVRPVSIIEDGICQFIPYRSQSGYTSLIDDSPSGVTSEANGARSNELRGRAFDVAVVAPEVSGGLRGGWKSAAIKFFYREDPIVDHIYPRDRVRSIGRYPGHPLQDYANQIVIYGRNFDQTVDGYGGDLSLVRFSNGESANVAVLRGPDIDGCYWIPANEDSHQVAVIRTNMSGLDPLSYLDRGLIGYAEIIAEKRPAASVGADSFFYAGSSWAAWRYSTETGPEIEDNFGVGIQSKTLSPLPGAILQIEPNSTIQYRIRSIYRNADQRAWIAAAVNIDGDLYELAAVNPIDPSTDRWAMVSTTIARIDSTSAVFRVWCSQDDARDPSPEKANIESEQTHRGPVPVVEKSYNGLVLLAEAIIPIRSSFADGLLLNSIDEKLTIGRRPYSYLGRKLFGVNSGTEQFDALGVDAFNGEIDEIKIVVGSALDGRYWGAEWNKRQPLRAELYGEYQLSYGIPLAAAMDGQVLLGASDSSAKAGLVIQDDPVFEATKKIAIECMVGILGGYESSSSLIALVSKYDEIMGGYRLYLDLNASPERFVLVTRDASQTETTATFDTTPTGVGSLTGGLAIYVVGAIDTVRGLMGIGAHKINHKDNNTGLFSYQKSPVRELMTSSISTTAISSVPGQNIQPVSVGSEVKLFYNPARQQDYSDVAKFPSRQAIYRFDFNNSTDAAAWNSQVYSVRNDVIDADHLYVSDPDLQNSLSNNWGYSCFNAGVGATFSNSSRAYVPGSAYNSVNGLSRFAISGWFKLSAAPASGSEFHIVHRKTGNLSSTASAGTTRLFSTATSDEGYLVAVRNIGGATRIEFRWADSTGTKFTYRLQGGSFADFTIGTWYAYMFSIDYDTGLVSGCVSPYASTTSSSVQSFYVSDALTPGATMISSDTVQEDVIWGGTGSEALSGFLDEQMILYGASIPSASNLIRVCLGYKSIGIANIFPVLIDQVRISSRPPFKDNTTELADKQFSGNVPWSHNRPALELDNENLATMELIELDDGSGSIIVNQSVPSAQAYPIAP